MNNRERVLAVLKYESYDRLPVLHFGFWPQTLAKWADQGHISKEEAEGWIDGNLADQSIGDKLGFDANYTSQFHPETSLLPYFEPEIIEKFPDGSRKVLDFEGAIVLEKPGTVSIPAEIDHTLKDRKSWEEIYLPRLQFTEERINSANVYLNGKVVPFGQGGKELFLRNEQGHLLGLFCGSLFGVVRNWLGVEGMSYLQVDDSDLFDEMLSTVSDLCYQIVKKILESGIKFDIAHFWEDICFKSGPLVSPRVFDAKVGPSYQRITELLKSHGIELVSLDCDGLIDSLIPTWFNNGVNTMFPIEVGTWDASIKPWRQQYGKQLRGVGGMRKQVFAEDFAAIDAEIERLKPLVDLGGYIPCPDHRIPSDGKWDNVRYYCDQMRSTFS